MNDVADEIGGHVGDVVVVAQRLAGDVEGGDVCGCEEGWGVSDGLAMWCGVARREVSIGDDVGVALVRGDGGGVVSLGRHVVHARRDALEAVPAHGEERRAERTTRQLRWCEVGCGVVLCEMY